MGWGPKHGHFDSGGGPKSNIDFLLLSYLGIMKWIILLAQSSAIIFFQSFVNRIEKFGNFL